MSCATWRVVFTHESEAGFQSLHIATVRDERATSRNLALLIGAMQLGSTVGDALNAGTLVDASARRVRESKPKGAPQA